MVGDRPNATKPDLALEVVQTRGGLDKLEIYRRLGVKEVWSPARARMLYRAALRRS